MSAPERIWAVVYGVDGAVINGGWADTVRHFGGGVEYVRADLCACAQSKPDQNLTLDVKGLVEAAFREGFNLGCSLSPNVHQTLPMIDEAWKASKARIAVEGASAALAAMEGK